ncbi:MAG: DUF6265 family protein [Candidatus Krumholzibacteriota bacterium]
MLRNLILAVFLACSSGIATADELESIAWLEGHWVGEAFGGTMEEVWIPAAGNAMHGVFRLTVQGRLEFSEFLQVTAEDGQIVMRFEHFRPDYSTWEGDGPPMELKVTEAAGNRVVFEALKETSNSRITYTMDGAELLVTVSGVDEVLRFRRR